MTWHSYLSGGIYHKEDVKDVYLMLDHYNPYKAELKVYLMKKKDISPTVEFRSTPEPAGENLLAKINLKLSSPNVDDSVSKRLPCSQQHVSVKDGCPSDDELEGLSERIISRWKKLGRRLKFDEEKLTAMHKENEECSEKVYALLVAWKKREGSAATYRVLHEALCHEIVNRRDLGHEFCEL